MDIQDAVGAMHYQFSIRAYMRTSTENNRIRVTGVPPVVQQCVFQLKEYF